MTNLIKKNTKRALYITAAILIAVTSVFMFLPKEKNSAKALSSEIINDETIISLTNYPSNLCIYEYFSATVGSGVYSSFNTNLNLSISSKDGLTVNFNQSLPYRFYGSGLITNTNDYNLTLKLPLSYFTRMLYDIEVAYDFLFYQPVDRGDGFIYEPYSLSSFNFFADFYVNRGVALDNGDTIVRSFKELVVQSDYLETGLMTTNGVLWNVRELQEARQRNLIFMYAIAASDSFRTNPNVSFSSLVVETFDSNQAYFFRYTPIGGLEYDYNCPMTKFTFYGENPDYWLSIRLPIMSAYRNTASLYLINNGDVNKDSVAYINGYNNGYNTAYDELYNSVYDKAFSSGEASGYNKGYEKGAASSNGFLSLFTAVVDAPVQVFTDLFDFEILGVNMSTFFLSILSLCIVTMVIRWFI